MAAAAVTTVLAVASPASAASRVTWEHHWQAGRGCLDHNFGQGVYNYICTGSDWQKWEVKYYPDGTARFMSSVTKMCLDASEYGVRGFGCNDLPYQRWKVNSWGGGWYELVNQYTHHCLDSSEYGVRDVGCNGLAFQKWTPSWS